MSDAERQVLLDDLVMLLSKLTNKQLKIRHAQIAAQVTRLLATREDGV